MVIAGMGALASLGLALPTGLAFGYGYGYGVRQGYHAFRPSKSSVTKDLHLSPNPVTGAKGAGLLSAEEMTSKQATSQNVIPTQQTTIPPQSNGKSLVTPPSASKAQGSFDNTYYYSKKKNPDGSPKKLRKDIFRNDKEIKHFKLYGTHPFEYRKQY